MLETSVDLRSSQAWSQFDDAMTQFGGGGGGVAPGAASPAAPLFPPGPLSPAESDEELSDSGAQQGLGVNPEQQGMA